MDLFGNTQLIWSGYADAINSLSGQDPGVPDGLVQFNISQYCSSGFKITFLIELYVYE